MSKARNFVGVCLAIFVKPLIRLIVSLFQLCWQKCLSAMATIVQSRFAGLMIEDDVPSSVDKSKKTKNQAVKKQEPPKKPKSKPATQQNGTTAGGKKKNKKIVVTEEQWEQWKQKDEEMVDGNFETDLTQAILLSKLDFEEKKDVYKQMRKQAEADKKLAEQAAKEQNKSGKKQKKKNVMSLDQFNDMVSGDDQKRSVDEPPEVPQLNNNDHEFFERVESEAQVELLKDKHKAQVLQRQPTSDQVINRVQFAEALDRKDKEIEALKDEHTRLKEELLLVKSRNKKLCNILGQGEMRDKAEALVEVERLRQVQSELTAEVASLHAQLEQERSRHPDPRSKDKRKKSAIDKEK